MHESNWLVRAATWITDHGVEAALIVVPIIAAGSGLCCSEEVASVVSPEHPQRVIRVAIAVVVGSGVLQAWLGFRHLRGRRKISALRQEIQGLNHRYELLRAERDSWVSDYVKITERFIEDG